MWSFEFALYILPALFNLCQVVDAPEILAVIGKIPYLSEFLNSLYDCQYKSFFSAFGTWISPISPFHYYKVFALSRGNGLSSWQFYSM